MKNAAGLIAALRYKLRTFGVPIDGPTEMFFDNEAVYKNEYIPDLQLRKKHHRISYHRAREAVTRGACRIENKDTSKKLSDLFTGVLPRPRLEYIMNKFTC